MLAAADPDELAAEDAAVCREVLRLPEWQEAKCVFCYIPCGRELDVTPLLRAALAAGKTLCAPRITGPGQMAACRVDRLSLLAADAFGIPAPPADAPVAAPAAIDLVILPGMAFHPTGKLRLGRGGGYYDRWLRDFSGVKVAPVRRCQLREDIPAAAHDIPADIIVTAVGAF